MTAARVVGARLRGSLQILLPLLLTAAVFGIWDLVVRIFDIQPYVLPTPHAVFSQIGTDWDVLQPAMFQTIEEFVIGFAVGVACGFVLAVAMGQSRILQRGLYPLLIASQAVPIIAIAAALVIWLGFGLTPKIVIVALIVFFPVVVNVLDGLTEANKAGWVSPIAFAMAYTKLGERDRAFEWLDKAFAERAPWLALLQADPDFEPLRNDSRFGRLARRIGLP